MRHNPKHAVTDEAVVRTLIEDNPWGTIVSVNDGELVASHYPILLDESDELAVVTHVGRPDETVHGFGGGQEILLIVAGPHGYISPSWYAPGAMRAPDVELQRRALLRRAGDRSISNATRRRSRGWSRTSSATSTSRPTSSARSRTGSRPARSACASRSPASCARSR